MNIAIKNDNLWYCSLLCEPAGSNRKNTQRKNAQRNESIDTSKLLFNIIANRLGYDVDHDTYIQFQEFMVFHTDHIGSIHECMEDWLEGWNSDNHERKCMLRNLFRKHELVWTADTFTLYHSWSKGKSGNRYQKMIQFIDDSYILF